MPQEFVPYEVVPGEYSKGLILLCDHARNTIPQPYGTLGLPACELERHIAYDIGAETVMRGLAAKLGVPGVLATYSRLLIDPNRGEDDPTLIRQIYDGTIIPGNYPLSDGERKRRRDAFYRPYHEQVSGMIDDFLAQDIIPAVIAIHSMTDRWNGLARPWHLSVLWDSDPRLAGPLLTAFRALPDITVGENEPYDGALAGDTMHRHCTSRGLSHALIEIRQDLVREEKDAMRWVDTLSPIIEKVSALPHNHVMLHHGSRTGR
ncbi:N-formylglutamate amidohydrolase [Salaquimonas pukyongi]|uniref:N-formylglutamate amidohydrolase n=1 Tax=Salaquimonas pukyongi TaxID=2712698 RepID=UPI00096BBF3A|nr:N-formylglutamate amidohydrolase [Salaquimonas pukyongi]